MADGRVDLSQDAELTSSLIASPLDWRVRAVEYIEIDSAATCGRHRSLQVAPLRELMPTKARKLARKADSALIALPVVSVPRGALLRVDVEGPAGAPAFVLPRAEISRRQTDYLMRYTEDIGLGSWSKELEALVTALLSWTAGEWNFASDEEWLLRAEDYLRDGLDPGQSLDFASILQLDSEAFYYTRAFSEDLRFNVACHPALSFLEFESDALRDPERYTLFASALGQYVDLVKRATVAVEDKKDRLAEGFMNSLADYGQNYDLTVVTEVPLDEPFSIKYSERRAIDFGMWFSTGAQEVIAHDAVSNHVVVTTGDPNFRIRDVTSEDPQSGDTAFGNFTQSSNPEAYSVYAYGLARPYRVILHISVAPLRRLQFTSRFVAILLILLTISVLRDASQDVSRLALILGPSALAASVLLNREPNSLGSVVRRKDYRLLAALLATLLLAGISSYLGIPVWSSVISWLHSLPGAITAGGRWLRDVGEALVWWFWSILA